ncbi:glycosyltransferase [Planobispora takensis]|uniref:Glycosyltransferase n=1 Tax=Planobispora takensis TaxID=1367882 RepID=A0A8J3SUV4_9ACTN|nr:hypothetical protein [Planobispora takensis]GIH99456.1 hypothetical protein Pta02_14650 [Planobispora takensis]
MKVLLCPLSDPGYLYPAIAIGSELRRRGADVHVLGGGAARAPVTGAGLPFLAARDYGARPAAFSVARWMREETGQHHAILRAAREVGAGLLLTSVLCHGALLAGERLDLPVVVAGLAAHLWEYRSGGGAEPALPAARLWRSREMLAAYRRSRERLGLAPRDGGHPLLGAALLLRGDPVLEFPGAVLPERAHHVGPCSWEPAPDPDGLARILDRLARVGKPVVYVHLGRIFGGTSPWPRLNAAFTGGPFQAVVELGRSRDPQPAPGADLVVVREPWMGPLIERAGLVLTSGTSAPVLNALLRGRPLGVSPAGSEQPLLAGACVRAGVAAGVPDDLDRDPVEVLVSVWRDRGRRARAAEIGRRLAAADGGGRAADIVQAVAAGRPVPLPGAGEAPVPCETPVSPG